MIDPAVPLPVSRDVLDALTEVQVTTSDQGPSAFQLQFSLKTSSPLHTLFLLSGGSPIPLVRVVIIATVNGTLATTRWIVAILENHQQADGSVRVPKGLQGYLGGLEVLEPVARVAP